MSYAVVSLLFITYALGFISAAPVLTPIDTSIGRSQTLMISATSMSIGYIALICAPPFPVVVVAFWFIGVGVALFLATSNTFIVNLLNGTVILGMMHGLYGVCMFRNTPCCG